MPRSLAAVAVVAALAACSSPQNTAPPGPSTDAAADVAASDRATPVDAAPAADLPAATDAPALLDVPAMTDAGSADAPAVLDVPGATDAPTVRDAASEAGFGAQCRSDRECTPLGLVCDRTAMRCVDCVMQADCLGAGQLCLGNRCVTVTHCTSSRMCPGQVCSTTLGYCVDCLADADCAAGTYCRSDNTCGAQVCSPNASHCVDGTHANVCDARGTSAADVACPAGQSCRGTACQAWVCTPGEASCQDSSTRRVCNADGGGFASTACAAGSSCTAGMCRVQVCTPGGATCADPVTRAVCNADGLSAMTSTCPAAPQASALCSGGTCTFSCNGTFRNCDGSAANGCEADAATDPSNCGACGAACPSGQSCSAGVCNTCPPPVAAPQVLFYGALGSIERPYLPSGAIVTVASDAMWASFTTTDFARYNLIVIGDPDSRTTPTTAQFQTAFITRATWSAAVRGRVVVSGLDPGFHATDPTAPRTGAQTLLRAELAWLAAGVGTGLYVSSDWGVRSMDYLGSVGTFSSSAASALGAPADAVTIVVPTHPILAGSTSASLSGWTTAAHSYFPTYPAAFTRLANVATSSAALLVRPSTICER